jgi:hypothetical protein
VSVTAEQFGVVFCGGGPAALGPFVAAARLGRWEEFLSQGIAIVEPGPVGPGSLAHYRIAANSLGRPFLECLDELPGPHFAALRDLPETRLLREQAAARPPLSVVAPFLARLGGVVAGLLEAHPRCAVLPTRVVGLRLTGSAGSGGLTGSSGVDVATGAGRTLRARRAVIATGGRPFADHRRTEIVPDLGLAEFAGRVHHSESFIDVRRPVPPVRGSVVIVGGSHSAWSVADLLVHRHGVDDITLVHRSAIRLYYGTAEQARSEGYTFDPVQDVCPASGQVNRYGGLRGRAHALARAALRLPGTAPVPVRLVQVGDADPAELARARRALRAAGTVVVANGFEANLPPIHHADGTPLTAAVDSTGTIVTPAGHLVDEHGTAHPELLAYGLGAGLAASAEVGGEPSYRRRADGVWLYQHDIGDIVLGDLLARPVEAVATGAPAEGRA